MSTWSKPVANTFKVNVKGVCDMAQFRGAVGGVMRDSEGNWVRGCKSMIGMSNSVIAELWSIFHGMKMAWDKEVKSVVVESESPQAVEHVNNPDPNFCFFDLVTMIRQLKGEGAWDHCDVVLVDDSANQPDVALANNTMSDHGGIVELDQAPGFLRSLLAADKSA